MSMLERIARGSGLAVLVDPGRVAPAAAAAVAREAAAAGAALLLLGNSFADGEDVGAVARALREGAPALPLLQFPATAAQLTAEVDAVLFLSLISGRNAQYLIEEQVRAVPFARRHREVEMMSTAYCLVDGGTVTSVESVSQTRPLPADKPELVAAHLSAAALMGMSVAYLDAGSGARLPISADVVRAARAVWRGPLFVGGGVRGDDAVRRARRAGADYVVVGSHVEHAGARAVRTLAAAAAT